MIREALTSSKAKAKKVENQRANLFQNAAPAGPTRAERLQAEAESQNDNFLNAQAQTQEVFPPLFFKFSSLLC